MVRPAKRSRSFRHVSRKAPGGRNVKHLIEKQPKRAHCAKCDSPLAGMARLRPIKLQNVSKSSKRPERPFAGMLCSACMRREIISKTRAKSQ